MTCQEITSLVQSVSARIVFYSPFLFKDIPVTRSIYTLTISSSFILESCCEDETRSFPDAYRNHATSAHVISLVRLCSLGALFQDRSFRLLLSWDAVGTGYLVSPFERQLQSPDSENSDRPNALYAAWLTYLDKKS